ncbi:hypothetical protein K2Z84_15270 [Candidatus Binatia bacterium]|jgi:hypothetical protein|nr:hypothetical protein [Candidatus Binatia bacterium]
MWRNLVSILLAGSLLSVAAGAAAQSPPPPVQGGVYDSFGRQRGPDNVLPRNDRVLQIQALQLGGLKISVFDTRGNLLGSQFLVRTCDVRYDGRLASYVQTFRTVPARRGTPVENVTFVFRINDPVGDYDVYFQQPGGPLRSEVIKRR